MLLYITAEEVFGADEPPNRGARPLHTIPDTVAALYDLGLRHHVRKAVMTWWANGAWEVAPDWRLDRLAIRTALFARERLGVEPGSRVVVFGRLGWLWPVADFAAMGFGAVPVGLEHDLDGDALTARIAEAAPKVVLATDPDSAARLAELRRAGRLSDATVVGEGLTETEGVVPLEKLLDFGATLDTAERAQSFRLVSRQIPADRPALWHAAEGGTIRLTHREAMAWTARLLRAHPAREGDVAYVQGPRVDLTARLMLAAWVGDGQTTTVLGRGEEASEDVRTVRPHKLRVTAGWLETVCDGQGPRWPAGLDRPWARRRILEAFGGRLRWVRASGGVGPRARRELALAGVSLDDAAEAGTDSGVVH